MTIVSDDISAIKTASKLLTYRYVIRYEWIKTSSASAKIYLRAGPRVGSLIYHR